MDCFLLTLGTHGDVELFRLLGRALARRGHRVTVGASPFYRQQIEQAEIGFLPIGSGTKSELAELFRSLAPLADRRARVKAYAERWARPQLAHSLPAVKAQLARTDYFINNLRTVWRTENRVIPGAAITYDPVGNVENLRKYAAQLAGFETTILEIVALPKALVDPDDEWGPQFHFTGFWRDDAPDPWTPSPALAEFMAAGPPPVAITMGSMMTFDPVTFAGTVQEALRLAGLRGVLIGGWSGEEREESGDENCFRAANIPYEWLFPRASLVVHHGGAGTVAAMLRAGRASLLLPQIPSQEYFARLLARAGVLADVLDVQNWTPAALASAMRRGTDEKSLQEAAQGWQKQVIAEHGLQRAVESIEAHAERAE